MEQLIKGKTEKGNWYVRPATWAGEWNAKHELVFGNTLFESDSESNCDTYIMNYKLLTLVKENPSLHIVPMNCLKI